MVLKYFYRFRPSIYVGVLTDWRVLLPRRLVAMCAAALCSCLWENRNALKVLFYDGTGLCLFYKRLDKGSFRLPDAPEDPNVTSVQIDERELEALLDGVDVQFKEEEHAQEKPRLKKRKILH